MPDPTVIAPAPPPPPPQAAIASVHLVFKTHLDIGFTRLAHEAEASYFESFLPQAKSASRLPESLWYGFQPLAPAAEGWRFGKLGSEIDPRRIVPGGATSLHAVEHARYRDDAGTLLLRPLDSALLSAGRPSLLDPQAVPRSLADEGVWSCLWNNVWGTNFTMWYEEDAVFRWDLGLE